MFKDAAEAITWAEHYAAKSNVKSQIGSLMKKGGGGEPVFDVALSISARVSKCEPQVHGLALKCIYGEPGTGRDELLGDMIADYLIACKLGKNKTIEQLKKLGKVTVQAERALEVYSDSYPVKRMAYDVGVSRQQFTTALGWVEARSESINVLRNWMASGKREMELWLDENNWFETGYVEEVMS